MEARGWEEAKVLIRKNTAAPSLKADLEKKTGGSEHLDNSISGAGNKSPGQSPAQQRRHDNEHRGTNRTKHGRGDIRYSSQGRRSRDSSNTRLCFNCTKFSTILLILAQNREERMGRIKEG